MWQLAPAREFAREAEFAIIFYRLVTELTYHSFCCVSFIRTKLLGPDLTQGGEISQGYEYQGGDPWEAMSEAAYHKCLLPKTSRKFRMRQCL